MQFSRYVLKSVIQICNGNLIPKANLDIQFYCVPARQQKDKAFKLQRTSHLTVLSVIRNLNKLELPDHW